MIASWNGERRTVGEMRHRTAAAVVWPAAARLVCGLLLTASLAVASTGAAQTPQAATGTGASRIRVAASRIEIVGALSSWTPAGNINGITFNSITPGSLLGSSYYINPRWGAQFEAGLHPGTTKDGDQTFSVGAVRRFQVSNSIVFVHGLLGGTRLTGPNLPTLGGTGYFYNGCQWGGAVTMGGGVDYVIPRTNGRLAVRFLQADYQHVFVNFGPRTTHGGGIADLDVVRLDSGLVVRLGKM